MRQRTRALSIATALLAAGYLASSPALAQSPASVAKTAAAAKVTEGKPYTPPRTGDGHPDFQGVWSNATNVPLERPADRPARAPARRAANTQADGQLQVHYDNSQFGLDRAHNKVAEDTRTSLITSPADGRIPALLPEAQQRAAAKAAYTRDHQWDGPESRPLGERCLMWPNEGPPMLSEGYNSDLQIVQGDGVVSILQEMIHDVRNIPTDGRPHIPANIHQWLGDSRGHWEGDTLVIDTTNFNDKTNFQRSSEHLHVVERLTRIADNTMQYEFTVEDPHTWAEPWSAKTYWVKVDSPIYEYACQEGNYGMHNNLSGQRAMERKAAEEAAQKAGK